MRKSDKWDYVKELYERYRNLMLKKAYEIVQDYEEAAEVLQETVIRMYRYEAQIRKQGPDLEIACVIVITRQTAYNYVRSKNRRLAHYRDLAETEWDRITDGRSPMEDQVIRQADSGMLGRAMGCLSDRERELLLYKYFNEMSDQEIGKTLGIKKQNVCVYISRARKHLKEILKKEGFEYEARG